MTIMAHDSTKIFRSETQVLLLDDDSEMLHSVAETLKQFSYKVTETSDRWEALSLLSDAGKKFDLVLAEAHLASANGCFLLQATIRMDIPTILMSTDNEDFAAATETFRNGAYFYLKKPIALESIKSLWAHAVTAKSSKPNVKDNGKSVLQINHQEKEQNKTFLNGTIDVNGTNESARKRSSWKAPYFTSDAYQFGHEGIQIGCSTSKNIQTVNDEPGPAMQIAGPVQGLQNYGGMTSQCMSVYIPQPLPSQDNEMALDAYQFPLTESNVNDEIDDDAEAHLKNIFLNDGMFEATLEKTQTQAPNFGMIDSSISKSGVDYSILNMIPNSNEPINNELSPMMEDENLFSGIDSLLFHVYGP